MYWCVMQSGNKYNLFRTAQMYGEIAHPTSSGKPENLQTALRVNGMPKDTLMELEAWKAALSTLGYTGSLVSVLYPTCIFSGFILFDVNIQTGFDFEQGKGLPVLLFVSMQDRDACWEKCKLVSFVDVKGQPTATLSRVHLRRKRVSKGKMVIPKWPTKTELMKELESLKDSGTLVLGEPLPKESTRDVLLPGGVVQPGEQLLQLKGLSASTTNETVCIVVISLDSLLCRLKLSLLTRYKCFVSKLV